MKKKKRYPRRCPLCNGNMELYQDYDGDWWLGCVKCEDYEVCISVSKRGNKKNAQRLIIGFEKRKK